MPACDASQLICALRALTETLNNPWPGFVLAGLATLLGALIGATFAWFFARNLADHQGRREREAVARQRQGERDDLMAEHWMSVLASIDGLVRAAGRGSDAWLTAYTRFALAVNSARLVATPEESQVLDAVKDSVDDSDSPERLLFLHLTNVAAHLTQYVRGELPFEQARRQVIPAATVGEWPPVVPTPSN